MNHKHAIWLLLTLIIILCILFRSVFPYGASLVVIVISSELLSIFRLQWHMSVFLSILMGAASFITTSYFLVDSGLWIDLAAIAILYSAMVSGIYGTALKSSTNSDGVRQRETEKPQARAVVILGCSLLTGVLIATISLIFQHTHFLDENVRTGISIVTLSVFIGAVIAIVDVIRHTY